MANNSPLFQCQLCSKELDRETSASACVVCEADHTSWVHQKCFDKAIDKAIRVRSSKSTSFENIARSPTHFWKTQKCPHADCIKWLAEYTSEAAKNPSASTDKMEGPKVSLKPKVSQYEDSGEEDDEDRNRCTATKVDGSRCNFNISDEVYKLCRRCSEKAAKQRELTESLTSDGTEESKSKSKLEKEKESKEKKKKTTSKSSQGLNSMLKSLAKPPPPPLSLKDKKLLIEKSPVDKAPPTSLQNISAPPGIFPPSFTSSLEANSPRRDVAPPVSTVDRFFPPGVAASYVVPEATPQSDASLAIVPPGVVSNEAELLNAVRYFIGAHTDNGKATPREIARYLGTLKGEGGSASTAIEVMRARFHKLRNLVEAFPKLFQLHEPSRASIEGGPEYEVSLAPGSPIPQEAANSRTPSPPLLPSLQEWKSDDTINSTDILSLMVPKMKPKFELPQSVDLVLDILGLQQFDSIFKEHEFLPNDLFLVTDDDLRDIGIPPGPRFKLRNWVNAQIFAG